jgi:hypothetical protein
MSLTAALAYARHGIPVLPVHTPDPRGVCSCDRGVRCDRPGKHPRLRHGLTEATTDPRLIEMWWARWPAANVGLRTGIAMDVADIDSAEGWHGLTHLLGGELPPGPRVRTGSGGWHLWFHPTGFGNRVRLLPGLDWRGVGGYVVAPPSRHVRGDYRWVRRPGDTLPVGPGVLHELIQGPADLRDLTSGAAGLAGLAGPADLRDLTSGAAGPARLAGPADLRDLTSGAAGPARLAGPAGLRDLTSGPDALGAPRDPIGSPVVPPVLRELIEGPGGTRVRRAIAYPDRYARAALVAEADRVASAPVGTRNDTLNRAAFALGRFVGAGLLDPGDVVRELDAAARRAGLGRAEVRRTIRSGLTAGRRSPIDPEADQRVA